MCIVERGGQGLGEALDERGEGARGETRCFEGARDPVTELRVSANHCGDGRLPFRGGQQRGDASVAADFSGLSSRPELCCDFVIRFEGFGFGVAQGGDEAGLLEGRELGADTLLLGLE